MKIVSMTILELREAFLKGELTFEAIIEAYLKHIKQTDKSIGAYLHVASEEALEKAKAIDERFKKGLPVGKLAGVPVAIKDNIVTQTMPTTCGSKMLENYKSPFDATVVKKIEEVDGIILGKLNMDEFAMGSTTENSYYQATKNPHNLKKVPGGSSGGSAAAVASYQAPLTLGSDTGGSIRQPASFCGVLGLKPTYGRISRYGLIAFASSLDQIGPLTRTTEDMAYVLDILFGHDEKDATSSKNPVDDFSDYKTVDQPLRIGLPKNYLEEGVSDSVRKQVLKTAEQLKEAGVEVEFIDLKSVQHGLPAYYIISSAEASSNLARFDGIQYGFRPEGDFDLDDLYKEARSQGFGKEVKRRILLGTYALSSGYYDAYYKKAQQVRSLIKADFDKLFEKYDAILTPTAPTVAYDIGLKTEDPIEMYMGDIYTVPVNIAGLPAISVNAGYDEDKMPIGVQFIGKAFDEKTLLRLSYIVERGVEDVK